MSSPSISANPNIHPREECELRKQENIRFAEKHAIPFVDADYDKDNWFQRVKGLEWEPERGARCTACFDMRFERTALYAHEHGYPVITSCLGISRWKNLAQINASRVRAAGRYPGMKYWEIQLAQERWVQPHAGDLQGRALLPAGVLRLHLLRCADTNKHRLAQGRTKIVLGEKYYGPETTGE